MTSTFKSIPIRIESGVKYTTEQGFSAIKDGVKHAHSEQAPTLKKPDWLRIRLETSPKYERTREIVQSHRLSTVCQESKCPNISECWSHGTATIMLLGSVCTRACKFCAVDTGNPNGWLDPEEPKNAAKSVQLMNLNYVVLTSVDRDDLADFGASQYAKAVREIKKLCPLTKVEALTPDFQGREECIDEILSSGVDVFAQNLETVERLTYAVRDPRAGYQQTLRVLAYAKRQRSHVITKTSLMLGLGETEAELKQAMQDLRDVKVDVLTLGQYMQPTKNHLPVVAYITPEKFTLYRQWGLELGFLEVAAGPLVRSSYRADRIFTDKNLGLPV